MHFQINMIIEEKYQFCTKSAIKKTPNNIFIKLGSFIDHNAMIIIKQKNTQVTELLKKIWSNFKPKYNQKIGTTGKNARFKSDKECFHQNDIYTKSPEIMLKLTFGQIGKNQEIPVDQDLFWASNVC